jgi:ferredoxin
MNRIIYYFTGTGNSLKVARDLAKELGSTHLVPIASLMDKETVHVSADQAGIVCPVYMWGLPLIVVHFVSSLVLTGSPYLFGIVTFGGLQGATLKQLDRLLAAKGQQLSAGFGVHMPGNYTPLYGAFPEEKQQRLFSAEAERVPRIAEVVAEGMRRGVESSFFAANMLLSGLVYRLGAPHIPRSDKDFWVNERCTSCGICTLVCPVKNIGMKEGMPKWLNHCQQCLACMHWCPQEAIEFGKNTPGRKRYRHPGITISDIIDQHSAGQAIERE